MSINDRINALERSGDVMRFQPQTRKALKRELFLVPAVINALNDRSSAVCLLVGRGHIFSAMERCVRGERVYAQGGKGGFLKRLQSPPAEIWEMRVTEPVAQARLFGRFARPDTIVVTHSHTRSALGKKVVRKLPSRHWMSAMKECEAAWNELFPTSDPFTGSSVHSYISENCDDFDLAP